MIKKKIRRAFGIPGRIFKTTLYYYFKFDKWHITTLYDRSYPNEIIRFLNAKPKAHRSSIVEIGCGLGDIIRNINYDDRTGYDLDRNALKAAAFIAKLTSNKISFDWFQFPESELKGKFSTIIMVNWIHHVEPPLLKSKVQEYFHTHLLSGGEILIDTVQHPEYKINHSIDFIVSGLDCKVISVCKDVRQREVFAITKN